MPGKIRRPKAAAAPRKRKNAPRYFFFDVLFFDVERFADEARFVVDFFEDVLFFDEDFFDEDFFALDFFDPEDFFADGTLPPSRRASDRPMAMACLRLVTFLPEPPLFSVPRFRSCIALSTFSDAFFPYFDAM